MAKRKVGNPAIVDTQRQGMTSVVPAGQEAAGNTQGRQVAGTSYAYSKVDDVSGRDFAYGTVVRKGNAKGGKPEAATKANRAPVMQDRLGPRFAIQAKQPGPVAPEASETQRNTRFVPSAINRSLPNFNYGRLG